MKGYVVCVYRNISNVDKLKEYAAKARVAVEKFKGKFIAPTGGGSTLGRIEVIQVQEYEKKPNGVFRPIGSTISLKFGGYDLNNLKVVGKVPGKN